MTSNGIKTVLGAALAALTVGVSLTACSQAAPAKPSVSACTAAYPAWFAASFAAGKTTPAPDACKGLTSDQVADIATAYLAKLASTS